MRWRSIVVACAMVTVAIAFSSQEALAHTTIHAGDYDVEVGWVDEPPIIGQRNAIVVNVSNSKAADATVDISNLTVDVTYGGETKALTLQPLSEDTTNQYIAPILPTVPGQYTVQLRGQLDTTNISSDVEPEEVVSADTLMFPSPANSRQPAGGSGWSEWLSIVALAAGLGGLILAWLAFRKTH